MTDNRDELIRQLSVRLAACSEVLGVLASRDGPAREIVRLRSILEAILEQPARAGELAREGLREA